MSKSTPSHILHQSGIYAFFNVTNGECYVGSAVNLWARARKHVSMLRRGEHKSRHFQSAWNKYGEPVFVWVVLEIVDDKTRLYEREQDWMDSLDSAYNMFRVAGGGYGAIPSAEKRSKIAAATRARWAQPGFREQAALRIREALANPTERACRSERRKRDWARPDYRATKIAQLTGRPISEETRSRFSAAQKRRYAENPQELNRLKAIGTQAAHTRWSKYRETHLLEHDGQSLCVQDWAQITGMQVKTLRARLQRGWSTDRALTTPVRSSSRGENCE